MSTAVCSYATLLMVKERLTQGSINFGSSDDSLLQSLCDQVNGWIESKTSRILGPIPKINTTVTANGAAGSQSVTLASAVGVNSGDALMFGPVSGTHEYQSVVFVTGNVVLLQSPLVATYANGTVVTRVQLLDGHEALENGRMLPFSNGVIGLTALELQYYTGDVYRSVPMNNVFLRPAVSDREPGWPATEIWMTDIPSAGNSTPVFFRGYGTAAAIGYFGWPQIPDEITGLALNVATNSWRRRGVGGGGDSVQIGSDGSRTVSLLLEKNDWDTIRRYTSKEAVII